MATETQLSPDYSFKNGLHVTERTFDQHGQYDDAKVVYTRDEIQDLPNSGQDYERDQDVAEAMAETHLAKGIGGRAIEYGLVGRGSELMVVRYGWGGNMVHPVAVNEAQALAASNPDKTLMFMNVPGAGRSDALPRSMSREIARSGSYDPLGEFTVEALASVFDDYDKISVRGHSMGGRTAISMVGAMDKPVEDLIVNDPPGSRHLGLKGMAEQYMVKEGTHISKYAEGPLDEHAVELQNQPVSSVILGMLRLVGNGGFWQQMVRDPLAMSEEGLQADLERAAHNVKNEIIISSPALSEINDWRDISDIQARIAKLTDATVRQRIIEGHTHALVTMPSILGLLYQDKLKAAS